MARKDMFTTDKSPPGDRAVTMLESSRMAQLAPVASAAPVPPLLVVFDTEVAWAAGLFEGEGSFGVRENGTVLLSLGSTDRDIIERFRDVIGTGRFSSQSAGKNRRKKTLRRVDVIRVCDVLRIIDLFYPWLGVRRRARADQVVAILGERIESTTFARECPFCKELFRPPFTPNAARTRFCSRLCERRWHSRERRSIQKRVRAA